MKVLSVFASHNLWSTCAAHNYSVRFGENSVFQKQVFRASRIAANAVASQRWRATLRELIRVRLAVLYCFKRGIFLRNPRCGPFQRTVSMWLSQCSSALSSRGKVFLVCLWCRFCASNSDSRLYCTLRTNCCWLALISFLAYYYCTHLTCSGYVVSKHFWLLVDSSRDKFCLINSKHRLNWQL